MAVVKEGILLASVKSDLITGITVGSSDAANLVLTESCRISVYNVSFVVTLHSLSCLTAGPVQYVTADVNCCCRH